MLNSADKANDGRRLQLRKKPGSSRTIVVGEKEDSASSIRSTSPNTDDSLADFKSPKASPLNPPRIFNNVKKIGSGRPGPRSSKRKASSNLTENSRSKRTSIDNQPLIESAFFKVENAKESFVCPLCLKAFSDVNLQTTHSKSCAAKNNVSTKKLLAAAELQKRQAIERLKLGLPAGPMQTPKKKSTNIRKLMPGGDPDIQLAMALSMSLKEMEQLEEFDEAVALVAESNESFLEMSNTQRRSTLQSFGFKTNKPVVEAPTKIKKKKLIGPTILQTRTQETRDRILTERIAEIIVDIEASTQLRISQENLPQRVIKKSRIRSNLLRSWYHPGQKLWNCSISNLENSEYYVKELSKYISPVIIREKENEQPNDEKQKDNNSTETEKNGNNTNIDENVEIEAAPDDLQSNDNEINSVEYDGDQDERSDTSSPDVSEIESIQKYDQVNELSDEKYEKNRSNNTINLANGCFDKNKIDESVSLAFDWSKMVDNIQGADIEIVVLNDRIINAHSAVFWARCSGLMNDCETNAVNKKIIRWSNIDYFAALWFLQFLYCGQILTCCFSNHKSRTDQLKLLANNYQMEELFEYLKKREAVICNCRKEVDGILESESTVKIDIENQEEIKEIVGANQNDIILAEDSDSEIEELNGSPNEIPQSQCELQDRITSPDLFDDSEDSDDASSTLTRFLASKESFSYSSTPTQTKISSSNNQTVMNTELIDKSLKKSPQISNQSEIINEKTSFHEKSLQPDAIPERIKSNLTLFIEKVQRKQEKNILDSDTEEDTPFKGKLPRRNPFKVHKDDEDSFLCIKKPSKEKNDQFIVEQKKKSAISMLEDRIRAGEAGNMKNFNRTLTNNIDISELSTDDEFDDLGESMYSKYRRNASSNNNSIEEHRKVVIELMKKHPELGKSSIDRKSTESKLSIEDTNQPVIPEIDDINFDESLELEVQESNPNVFPINQSSEKLNENNISGSFRDKLESPIDLTHLSDHEYEQSHDGDPPPVLSDEYHYPEVEVERTSLNNSQKCKEINDKLSNTAEINIEDDLEFESWTETSKSNEQSRKNDFQSRNNSKAEKSHQSIVNDDDVNLEVNEIFTQSLLSSQKTENDLGKNRSVNNRESHFERNNFTPSPISISSSSDISENPSISNFIPEADKENNFTKNLDINELISYPISPWSTVNEPGGISTPITSRNITFRSSTKITNEHEEKSTPSTSKNITFRPSRVLKERSFSSFHSIGDHSGDEMPFVASSTKSQSCLYSPIDVNDNKSTRFLASKSKSDSNFSKSFNRSSHIDRSDSTPVSDKLTYLKKRTESIRNANDVTPCPHYSRMTSPELVQELQKYGLKKKTKRCNAVKLLENLYERLHPIVPDSENNIEDEDEPPLKKLCLTSEVDVLREEKIAVNNNSDNDDDDDDNEKNNSEESSTSNLSIVPEEIDFEDLPESKDDKSTIKEIFNGLCKTDKVLHNKVLTYAPLPLEDLHAKLKLLGFKGKINDLMDFLDDECITFQVLDANRNKDRRKKTIKVPHRIKKKCDQSSSQNPS